jgi:hypothetical protein
MERFFVFLIPTLKADSCYFSINVISIPDVISSLHSAKISS